MNDSDFEELEQQVQTLAFQINGLKKNNPSGKYDQSLKVLEKDYRHYKGLYDKEVKPQEPIGLKAEKSLDW